MQFHYGRGHLGKVEISQVRHRYDASPDVTTELERRFKRKS